MDQPTLFNLDELETWREVWRGMPEYHQEDQSPWSQVIVSFKCAEDMRAFSKLVDQRITYKTQSIWYPEAEIGRLANKRFVVDKEGSPNEV